MHIDKGRITQLLLQLLKQDVIGARKRLETVRRAMIEAPGAMQSHSDTTKYQMGLVADEMCRLIVSKEEAITALDRLRISSEPSCRDTVTTGSLVEVETPEGERRGYLIFGKGGGSEVEYEGLRVLVVNPAAPLGKALVGKCLGDIAEVNVGGLTRALVICEIQ